MTIPRLEKLLPASFGGIPFLVSEERKPQRGRKIVIHDYPNSGKRYGQDMGPVVGEFDVTGFIHGDNFQELARTFEQVLNTEGRKRLVLPNEGAVWVKAMPYSVNKEFTRVGVVEYSLKFTLDNTEEDPGEAPATVEDTFQAADEAREEIQNQFNENYEVPESRLDVLTAISDYSNCVFDTVDAYKTSTIQNNSRIQNIVRDTQSNVVALIREPIQLSSKLIYGNEALLDGLFSTFSNLFTGLFDSDTEEDEPQNTKISANTALALKDFGNDFKDKGTSPTISFMYLWEEDTANRKLRNKNRVTMVESVRLNSLILAFEVAANFDYSTSDEIDRAIQSLEGAYEEIILVSDPFSIMASNDTIKELLDNVKNTCYNVLDQKAQQVYSTTTLNFHGVNSVMNLSYKLYMERLENTTQLEEIAEAITDLNPDLNPLEMTGEVVGFES